MCVVCVVCVEGDIVREENNRLRQDITRLEKELQQVYVCVWCVCVWCVLRGTKCVRKTTD